MRWRSALLVASSVAVAGCGHSARRTNPPPTPRIPAAVAQQLAADADAVAARPGCAARAPAHKLQTDAIRLISRVPGRYQEPLTSAINDLVARIPACPPPKENGDHHGRGKGKGHKHGGKGEE